MTPKFTLCYEEIFIYLFVYLFNLCIMTFFGFPEKEHEYMALLIIEY